MSLNAVRRVVRVTAGWFRYRHALKQFRREFEIFTRKAGSASRFEMLWADRMPCLDDRDNVTAFDRHYFYHLAWAARILAETCPGRHVDISSQNLFVATVSAFIPMVSCEYHPLPVELKGLEVSGADLCHLHFGDHTLSSLSCMHAVEHVGLGRYGDPLDPDGDLKAMGELQRVLAPRGQLLLVVPVGRPRIEFNAHRIYSYDQIVQFFDELTLAEFALIPDKPEQGHLLRHADPSLVQNQEYACGCFHFIRDERCG